MFVYNLEITGMTILNLKTQFLQSVNFYVPLAVIPMQESKSNMERFLFELYNDIDATESIRIPDPTLLLGYRTEEPIVMDSDDSAGVCYKLKHLGSCAKFFCTECTQTEATGATETNAADPSHRYLPANSVSVRCGQRCSTSGPTASVSCERASSRHSIHCTGVISFAAGFFNSLNRAAMMPPVWYAFNFCTHTHPKLSHLKNHLKNRGIGLFVDWPNPT